MIPYFEELGKRIDEEFDAIKGFELMKAEYAKTHTREEVEKWTDENQPIRSISLYEMIACRMYRDSMRYGNEDVCINEAVYSGNVPNLVSIFRKAGMGSFIFGKADINAFDILDDFRFEGCVLCDTDTFKWERHGKIVDVNGIRVLL